MVINRIADVGLALGISLVFLTFKSLDYFLVFSLSPKVINENISFLCFDVDTLTVISLLLFFGALGKSAQLGLHI
jgi:NADH:ubiquinone oxidoreductase subunit 5 (subunit L)/multisubunit Na+/H+ antiporter MnhA subunit